MAEYNQTITSNLYFSSIAEAISETIFPIYGNVINADSYFLRRPRSRIWFDASVQEKIAALTEATRIIDRLNFVGKKISKEQLSQFPRGNDLNTPNDIKFACYEIAIKLLDEVDPDLEVDNLGSTAQGFGGLRDTYSRSFVLEHIRAGVPSASAWAYLRPYLIDPATIRISRVD